MVIQPLSCMCRNGCGCTAISDFSCMCSKCISDKSCNNTDSKNFVFFFSQKEQVNIYTLNQRKLCTILCCLQATTQKWLKTERNKFCARLRTYLILGVPNQWRLLWLNHLQTEIEQWAHEYHRYCNECRTRAKNCAQNTAVIAVHAAMAKAEQTRNKFEVTND